MEVCAVSARQQLALARAGASAELSPKAFYCLAAEEAADELEVLSREARVRAPH